jgi:hypothetical protein
MSRRVLQLPLMPPHWRWATFSKVAEPNCRRFYRISIEPTAYGWAVITDRGRIGRTPRRIVEDAQSFEDAESIARKRAHDRFLHDYILTDAGVQES